jgi:hypothetical protein
MVRLGNYVKGDGEIPAGSDAFVCSTIITAGDKPIKIQSGHQYGGDATEYTRLILVAPNALLQTNKTDELVEAGNGTVMFAGNIDGGHAATDPLPLFGSITRQQMGANFILPPYYSICFYTSTANTAAYYATLNGFECEY